MEALKKGTQMIKEKVKIHNAAGIIPFIIEDVKLKFLLIKNNLGWEFPKGGLNEGESQLEAALRETKEETSLTFKRVYDFKFESRYFLTKNYSTGEKLEVPEPKTVTYFMGEASSKDVKLSWEHDSYGWFTVLEASKKLYFSKKKEVLANAVQFLSNEYK